MNAGQQIDLLANDEAECKFENIREMGAKLL